ncbi:hypothetical protein SPONN_2300 [uncultured Candidatus Thioglobus sp.]|nr:hypothetical protein SPONN_2300 [uncultured Candidatus Thioglobus sp.]
MIAFHTCEKNGQEEYKAPFLSEANNQWLTQGYYFWTDSDYFAKKWGESHYKERRIEYCIMKFTLSFKETELLDLVGNVDHKIKFSSIYKKITTNLKVDSLPFGDVIQYMRDFENRIPGAFSYKAIKSEDNRTLDLIRIPVVKGAKEKVSIGPTRQQLCVFENCYTFPQGEIYE